MPVIRTLRIIVPKGDIGGVTDHALVLARKFSVPTDIVELDKDLTSQIRLSPQDVVLLSYSGYGFCNTGAPLWLAEWVDRTVSNVSVFGTIFHELYATSAPYRRAFWYTRRQQVVAKRLALASSFVVTSRQGYWEWLKIHVGCKQHLIFPVFSNIGEPNSLENWSGTEAIVFGSSAVRQRLYNKHLAGLSAWSKKNNILVHDIGPSVSRRLQHSMRTAGIVLHGKVAADDVSPMFSRAGWGLVDYDSQYLAKSGVFASYASHGLCPIVFSAGARPEDGLIPGTHYVSVKNPAAIGDEIQPLLIRQNVFDWYQPHRVSVQARSLLELLNV